MSTPECRGTSRLEDHQSEWFSRKYGIRYVSVQDNADVAPRSERRSAKRRKRKRPDGKQFGG